MFCKNLKNYVSIYAPFSKVAIICANNKHHRVAHCLARYVASQTLSQAERSEARNDDSDGDLEKALYDVQYSYISYKYSYILRLCHQMRQLPFPQHNTLIISNKFVHVHNWISSRGNSTNWQLLRNWDNDQR